VADVFTRQNNQILNGRSAKWVATPAMTGVPAVGVVVTSGAGAWGAYADLIAASAITVQHWIGGFCIDNLGVAQIFEVQIRDATPASLFEFRINPTAVTPNLGVINPQFPIWRPANAQTQARAGGAAAKTIGITTLYTTAL